MRMSARGAQKTRDESKKLQMYSKQWLPGDTLRVFYPIFWEDGVPQIAVGAVWGFSVSDIKELGLKTAFIPSTNDFDENRTPIGQPDITYQFSKIAGIFINGMKQEEELKIEQKRWPSDAAKKEALKALEEKYDTKNNPKAKRAIIGKVQYYIATEVVSVKIANEAPVMDTATLSSAPLSSTVISKLYSIMEDPKYAPNPGDNYLEVEWHYPMDPEKGKSSRNATPGGLTPEYRFQNHFPDKFTIITSLLGTVMTDNESIVRRATRSINPVKIQQAITQYAYMNSQYLDMATEEDTELLCKNVELLDKIQLIPSLNNDSLIADLKSALAEYKENHEPEISADLPQPVSASGDVPEGPVDKDVAKTMEEIGDSTAVPDVTASLNPEAPTIANLLNNGNGNLSAKEVDQLTSADSGRVSDIGIDDIDLTTMV